jgi:glycosyltransferase involved in cell wall biosynthesis
MPTFLVIAGYKQSLVNFRGDMICDMIAAGFEVHVAAPELQEEDSTRQTLLALGAIPHAIHLDRNGRNPLQDIQTFLNLWLLMRRLKPDAVLAYTLKPVIYGLWAARLAGVGKRFALITGLGGALGGPPSSMQRLLVFLHRQALKGITSIIFQNSDDRAFYERHGLLSWALSSAIVNGSGVNLDRFPETQIPHAPLTFLMIARLLKTKGVEEFAFTAHALRKRHPEAQFRLVGWHEDDADFVSANKLKDWQESEDLIFTGPLKDVRPEIAGASVMVLPSYYPEGIPRTLLEALSTGRPIITTDMPGCRETVVDGENGYLIVPRSPEALLAACLKVAEHPDQLSEMGRASRRLAETRFDVAKVNADILGILQDGLAHPNKRVSR